jgi:hypothetical protein
LTAAAFAVCKNPWIPTLERDKDGAAGAGPLPRYAWVVTTIAGDGTSGLADNVPGAAARFNGPYGISAARGNLYAADTFSSRIRRINAGSPWNVTTIAGDVDGSYGDADGSGAGARFNYPQGITLYDGKLYVADFGNSRIRSIAAAYPWTVDTIAGTGLGNADGPGLINAKFSGPAGISAAGGILYVADTRNHRIRKIVEDPPGTFTVTTIAGNGTQGFADGAGTAARFNYPRGITIDAGGNLYVADTNNHSIRKLSWQRIN